MQASASETTASITNAILLNVDVKELCERRSAVIAAKLSSLTLQLTFEFQGGCTAGQDVWPPKIGLNRSCQSRASPTNGHGLKLPHSISRHVELIQAIDDLIEIYGSLPTSQPQL